MSQQIPPKCKYIPHKILKEGITHISVGDSDSVIEVHLDINKIMRILDANTNQPIIAPDGFPMYSVQWGIRYFLRTYVEAGQGERVK